MQKQCSYLDYLIDLSFQGVNKPFVLSIEDNPVRTGYREYSRVEIKDCDVKIDGRSDFDQPVKDNIKTYENIQKFTKGQGDNYATGCSLDFP